MGEDEKSHAATVVWKQDDHDIIRDTDIAEELCREGDEIDSSDCANWSTRRIYKNLLIICLVFLLLFTAFQGLSNLQSSINCDAGLGLASLTTIYGTLVLSAILVPSVVIRLMGMKWTLSVSIFCFCVYFAANFYPDWGTLMPTSALVGLAAAPLWASKSTYLTTIARRYAEKLDHTANVTVHHFFGIFFLFLHISNVLGNLISSLVLQKDRREPPGGFACGANDCPGVMNGTSYCDPPGATVTFALVGIYLVCGLAAMVIVSISLDKLKTSQRTQTENSCQLFMATVRLLKDYRMLLLIPLTIFSGLEQAFITGVFTRSYVTCTVGVNWVGYVMICYGVTDAVCSFVVGRMVRHVGRISLFTFGALAQMTLIITLMFWFPTNYRLEASFAIAACWGATDAVWQTQLNALYGVLFPDRPEAAFSNYRLWESIGFTISFAFGNYFCVWVKLAALAMVLVFGIGFYYIIEMKAYMRRRRHDDKDDGEVDIDLILTRMH